jgi:hypothetical protein
MPNTAALPAKKTTSARLRLARGDAGTKASGMPSRSRTETAAQRRELATLLRTIRGLMRQTP